MAGETVTVRMSRSDTQTPWGFRLEGGVDYQRPIIIAGVTPGSLAERAGLQQGDIVTKLCGRDAQSIGHLDAQNAITASGNNVDMVLNRNSGGGGAYRQWKPSYTVNSAGSNDTNVTISKFQHSQHGGASQDTPPSYHPPPPPVNVSLEHHSATTNVPGYNRAAQPYRQYNSPASLYSKSNRVDEYLLREGGLFGTDPGVQKALNSPAGAMGVNPATLAAVKAEDEARTRGRSRSPGYQPSPQQQQMAHRTAPHQQINQQEYGDGRDESLFRSAEQSGSFKRLTHALHAEKDDYLKTKDPLLRKMQRKNDGAMIAKTIHNLELMQKAEFMREAPPQQQMAPAGAPVCDHCGRHILGVFCQAAGKTFHGDCFKCCTCGSSLKNVGFSNIAGKLYCDIHAAQRQQNQFTSRPPQDPSIFVNIPRGRSMSPYLHRPGGPQQSPSFHRLHYYHTPQYHTPHWPYYDRWGRHWQCNCRLCWPYAWQYRRLYYSPTRIPHAPKPEQPRGQQGPIRAFYQPDILKAGPLLATHVPPPSSQYSPGRSAISPSLRGVPKPPHMYGGDIAGAMDSINLQSNNTSSYSSQLISNYQSAFPAPSTAYQWPPHTDVSPRTDEHRQASAQIWARIASEGNVTQSRRLSWAYRSTPAVQAQFALSVSSDRGGLLNRPPPIQRNLLRHATCTHSTDKMLVDEPMETYGHIQFGAIQHRNPARSPLAYNRHESKPKHMARIPKLASSRLSRHDTLDDDTNDAETAAVQPISIGRQQYPQMYSEIFDSLDKALINQHPSRNIAEAAEKQNPPEAEKSAMEEISPDYADKLREMSAQLVDDTLTSVRYDIDFDETIGEFEQLERALSTQAIEVEEMAIEREGDTLSGMGSERVPESSPRYQPVPGWTPMVPHTEEVFIEEQLTVTTRRHTFQKQSTVEDEEHVDIQDELDEDEKLNAYFLQAHETTKHMEYSPVKFERPPPTFHPLAASAFRSVTPPNSIDVLADSSSLTPPSGNNLSIPKILKSIDHTESELLAKLESIRDFEQTHSSNDVSAKPSAAQEPPSKPRYTRRGILKIRTFSSGDEETDAQQRRASLPAGLDKSPNDDVQIQINTKWNADNLSLETMTTTLEDVQVKPSRSKTHTSRSSRPDKNSSSLNATSPSSPLPRSPRRQWIMDELEKEDTSVILLPQPKPQAESNSYTKMLRNVSAAVDHLRKSATPYTPAAPTPYTPSAPPTSYAPPPPLAASYAPPPPAFAPPSSAPFTTAAPPPSSAAPPGGGRSGGQQGGSFAPLRGRGVLKQLTDVPRIPVCEDCRREIRGPFILAIGKTWCPNHFKCANGECQRDLLDVGFVEEQDKKYCETCFEKYLAPRCAKCARAVVGDCLNALDKQFHPECFTCTHCNQPFGNGAFFLEDGKAYCEHDWNQLFTTKCIACKFPIEAGDRWVEALNAAYHSDCFQCTMCHKNLEGQSFYAKGGHPYCKAHA